MIALNSKTYIGWGNDGQKLSTKGVSKLTNDISVNHFQAALEDHAVISGVNHGFRLRNGRLMQYEQERAALTFLYPKRIVHEDGFSTSPLLICKWKPTFSFYLIFCKSHIELVRYKYLSG